MRETVPLTKPEPDRNRLNLSVMPPLHTFKGG